MYIINEQVISG